MHPPNMHPHHFKKLSSRVVFFGLFILLLFILLNTAFSGKSGITGNVILSENGSIEGIIVKANLDIPDFDINLNNNFEKIRIQGGSDSFLNVGREKFDLSHSKKGFIVLEDFIGKISFNAGSISVLKGNAKKILINGVPISPIVGNHLEVELNGDLNYSYLDIKEGVFISKLEYITDGSLRIGEQTTLNLNDDKLILNDFFGALNIENKEMSLNGIFNKIEIDGESNIVIN